MGKASMTATWPNCCPREAGLVDQTTQLPAIEPLTARPTAVGRAWPHGSHRKLNYRHCRCRAWIWTNLQVPVPHFCGAEIAYGAMNCRTDVTCPHDESTSRIAFQNRSANRRLIHGL